MSIPDEIAAMLDEEPNLPPRLRRQWMRLIHAIDQGDDVYDDLSRLICRTASSAASKLDGECA